ncbi:hypothetical protein PR048_024272 [Dryococelus australis]|uniref:Uncharacterized protein n=1 Tax=Dryococelus australis TaxID=614101 RepID=A0ABQ9GN73_9NEOP|nr:hypothetical protein PR048_024272 [Dryococelus australis]
MEGVSTALQGKPDACQQCANVSSFAIIAKHELIACYLLQLRTRCPDEMFLQLVLPACPLTLRAWAIISRAEEQRLEREVSIQRRRGPGIVADIGSRSRAGKRRARQIDRESRWSRDQPTAAREKGGLEVFSPPIGSRAARHPQGQPTVIRATRSSTVFTGVSYTREHIAPHRKEFSTERSSERGGHSSLPPPQHPVQRSENLAFRESCAPSPKFASASSCRNHAESLIANGMSSNSSDSISFCAQWHVCWSLDSAPTAVERLPRKQFSKYDDDDDPAAPISCGKRSPFPQTPINRSKRGVVRNMSVWAQLLINKACRAAVSTCFSEHFHRVDVTPSDLDLRGTLKNTAYVTKPWTPDVVRDENFTAIIFISLSLFYSGATVAERLTRSPPTKANQAQSPAGSPDFRKWESCRTMPLVGGFSRIPCTLRLHPCVISAKILPRDASSSLRVSCQSVPSEECPTWRSIRTRELPVEEDTRYVVSAELLIDGTEVNKCPSGRY